MVDGFLKSKKRGFLKIHQRSRKKSRIFIEEVFFFLTSPLMGDTHSHAVLCRTPLLKICMCLLGIEASHPRYQHEQDDKESVNCRDVLDRPLKTNQQSLDE